MKLGTKGRYAVMALVDLATFSDGGPVPLADISARQAISLSYLEQLFAKLRRHNLVESVRGPGGGYRLARPTSDTMVGEIIAAVDEHIETTACKKGSGIACTGVKGKCATHNLWDALRGHIFVFLNAVSLDDVVSGRFNMADVGLAGDAPRRPTRARRPVAEPQAAVA
jgi:Rrf2 family iron-sulfur cluster assembly transcriptional regulator